MVGAAGERGLADLGDEILVAKLAPFGRIGGYLALIQSALWYVCVS